MPTDPRSDTASSTNDIQAVSRAAQILALFGPARPAMTVAEAAQTLGLNRSTTNRYFSSLEAAGFIARHPETPSMFEPSRLLLQIGAFALARQSIVAAAPAAMRTLVDATGLTVVLSLWGPAGPVVVHSEAATEWGAVISVRVGTQLPLEAAQTKVFLAWHDDQLLVDRLLSHLQDSQRAQLFAELAALRSAGLDHRIATSGVSIFAAPIFDARGICATIAVLGTTVQLPVDASPREAEQLVETARLLTEHMGGVWPGDQPARS